MPRRVVVAETASLLAHRVDSIEVVTDACAKALSAGASTTSVTSVATLLAAAFFTMFAI